MQKNTRLTRIYRNVYLQICISRNGYRFRRLILAAGLCYQLEWQNG